MTDLLFMLAALVAGTAVAAALGAADLGTALSIGTIVLAATAVWVILRRP